MPLYTLHLLGHFVPLELRNDDEAIKAAERDPNILRVVRWPSERVVWTKPLSH
jgi:hypothetical protein